MGSQVPFKGKDTLIRVGRQKHSIITILKRMFPEESEQQDWRSGVKEKIKEVGHGGSIKELKKLHSDRRRAIQEAAWGILSRCISEKKGKLRLEELHSKTCGVAEKISLYRSMQHMRYYWSSMNKEAAAI